MPFMAVVPMQQMMHRSRFSKGVTLDGALRGCPCALCLAGCLQLLPCLSPAAPHWPCVVWE
jgi:hypothetical protein